MDNVSLEIEKIFSKYNYSDFTNLAIKISHLWEKGNITKGANLIKKEQREQSKFIGIDFKLLELIGKEICKNIKNIPIDFVPLAINLWKDFGREGRLISTYIFGQLILNKPDELITVCKDLVKDCASWEECDNMAMKGLEPIFRKYPEKYLDTLNTWVIDKNKWVKRTSVTIIGRLVMVKGEYTIKCLNMITPCLEDNDADVMKANSFALRVSSRGNLNELSKYIKENIGGDNYSKIWVFADFIKSMTKKFLPEFKELQPYYEKWRKTLSKAKSIKTIDSALKILESL